MVKRTTPSYTEDEVREAILKFLYKKWKDPAGMDTAKVKISEIKKALKEQGIGYKEVIRNLQYLVDTNWVKENVKKFSVNTGRFSIPSEMKSYTISSQGIDFLEGRSKFGRKEGTAGINIENVSGIAIIGDNNYVRQEFRDLFTSLDELDNRIRMTNELRDDQKVEYSAEVRTIQKQLAKPNPSKEIIGKAWGALRGLATVGSLATFAEKVKTGIEHAIGSLPPPT